MWAYLEGLIAELIVNLALQHVPEVARKAIGAIAVAAQAVLPPGNTSTPIIKLGLAIGQVAGKPEEQAPSPAIVSATEAAAS